MFEMSLADNVFLVAILFLSAIIHEVCHGYAAYFLGDGTAKYQGRLTLNPLKHIDIVGTIIVPVALILMHAGFFFAWAKPVPYNPYNLNKLRSLRWSESIVAFAGPLSNIVIALLFVLVYWLPSLVNLGFDYSPNFIRAISIIVLINLSLAVFNLMPVPPLDGSKLLFNALPEKFRNIRQMIERYSFVYAILFIIFVWDYFAGYLQIIYQWLLGTL